MKSKKLTNRQKKLVQLISENFGIGNPAKSLYALMLEAGYEESTAKQQSEILKRLGGEVGEVVSEINDHRNEVIKEMRGKFKTAQYHHLVDAFDKLTKNHQLLTGGKTENLGLDELKESLKTISGKK